MKIRLKDHTIRGHAIALLAIDPKDVVEITVENDGIKQKRQGVMGATMMAS